MQITQGWNAYFFFQGLPALLPTCGFLHYWDNSTHRCILRRSISCFHRRFWLSSRRGITHFFLQKRVPISYWVYKFCIFQLLNCCSGRYCGILKSISYFSVQKLCRGIYWRLRFLRGCFTSACCSICWVRSWFSFGPWIIWETITQWQWWLVPWKLPLRNEIQADNWSRWTKYHSTEPHYEKSLCIPHYVV